MEAISRELIERAAAGDDDAFEQIYRQSGGFVYSLALRMTRNTADAEEVTQDAFIKIHKHLKRFEGRSSFKTWIYRIASNTALDFCRKRSNEKARQAQFEAVEYEGVSSPEARQSLQRADDAENLDRFLQLLNDDQRVCLVLREIEGLNYSEIAETLKINLNTVRSRLKRARETMMSYAKKGVVRYEM